MFDDIEKIAYFAVALLLALSFHESAHAFVADRLGDPTARKLGRITMNPFVHLDPTGTLLIIMASIFGVGFGWAKPVPVNPANLKGDPKTSMALVSVAGPISNLLLAAIFSFLAVRIGRIDNVPNQLLDIFFVIILVNVSLAAFNLLPIPPLDGFSVLLGLLPRQPANALMRVEQYGPPILLLIVFLGGSYLSRYLNFVSTPILRFLFSI